MSIETAYNETLDYLYERLPMFSRIGGDALKNNLDNILKLSEALGTPQNSFKSIHVAGTNGKGSTSHMLAAVLREAGYKTGLYTSPHLFDFRERIRIDGQMVGKEWVVEFIKQHKALIENIEPSFFEITVAMAFSAFAASGVEVAVIETGMGGRLDSTNIIEPILSVITNISYDHKEFLGQTLKEIAFEKAGIIKPGVPVVIGEQQEETRNVFFEKAVHSQSNLYYAQAQWDLVRVKKDAHFQYFKAVHKGRREMYDLCTDLLGDYQHHNIKTVLAATEILMASQGLNLSIPEALKSLSRVSKLTGLRGRWEFLGEDPLLIADVAHNPAGIREVMDQWALIKANNKHILAGFVKDKDVREVLALFPKDSIYHFCQAQLPRALPSGELHALANEFGMEGNVYKTVGEALQSAKLALQEGDALLIVGSFFIVGEALEYLEMEKKNPLATENRNK